MTTRPIPSSGTCGACGKESQNVLKSALNPNKALCIKCIHAISVAMGKTEEHAVQCIKCKSTAGFYAIYEGKTPAKLHFIRHEEDDESGVPVYLLESTVGAWSSQRAPVRFKCDKCDTVIYYFVPFINPYVKKYLP